ncbi:MAG: TIGR04283 family arsenosugar biosynthesis glycosyltransferase [Hyphomicrobium sp.]
MISVVIPALDAEKTLAATLGALVPAAVDGVVREVIVVDGGSRDRTTDIADLAGADVIHAAPSRGGQLSRGAAAARFPWLLFLHADTILYPGWTDEALGFMRDVESGHRSDAAGVFRFSLNDRGFRARSLETSVRLRCALLAMPYGDQGLLISRRLFDDVGGYEDLPIMEDVDIVRRIGRRRLQMFETPAVTSADRYRKDGYLLRSLRNQLCLALFGAGLPASKIVRIYGRAKS